MKGESTGEIGTSVASMNRTGKVTAKKGPYDEYNAFKEIFDRETEAHIIAAWMSFAGIQKMSGDYVVFGSIQSLSCVNLWPSTGFQGIR